MSANDLTSDGRLLRVVLAVLLLMAALAGVDLFTDLSEGTTARHVWTEAGIVVIAFMGAGLVVWRLRATMKEARIRAAEAETLADALAATQADAAQWREEARDLVAGLSRAIDAQFERWALTPAEKEVGLLLLKGLSHREVAAARSVTEATARQQARAIYKKAGLTGRADLAAFFLEDLMLPAALR